jgi:hypothetical protein
MQRGATYIQSLVDTHGSGVLDVLNLLRERKEQW